MPINPKYLLRSSVLAADESVATAKVHTSALPPRSLTQQKAQTNMKKWQYNSLTDWATDEEFFQDRFTRCLAQVVLVPDKHFQLSTSSNLQGN